MLETYNLMLLKDFFQIKPILKLRSRAEDTPTVAEQVFRMRSALSVIPRSAYTQESSMIQLPTSNLVLAFLYYPNTCFSNTSSIWNMWGALVYDNWLQDEGNLPLFAVYVSCLRIDRMCASFRPVGAEFWKTHICLKVHSL